MGTASAAPPSTPCPLGAMYSQLGLRLALASLVLLAAACGGGGGDDPAGAGPPFTVVGYSGHPALYVVGNPIQPNVPNVTGAPDSWSVTPDLPLGLNLDPLLGHVTGTPLAPVPPTVHIVRASLGADAVEVELSIEVRELYFTELVSRADDATPANNSSSDPAADFSGRHVAFTSFASNLVPGDTNGHNDVFVRDLFLGSTRRVSVSSAGAQANETSFSPAVSRTGRWVAFSSFATTLVAGDTNAFEDVFLHDLDTDQTTRISVSSLGVQALGASGRPAIAETTGPEAALVAFQSRAENLDATVPNGSSDIYVREVATGVTRILSKPVGAAAANGDSVNPSLSEGGQWCVFTSSATNLTGSLDNNGATDIFVRELAQNSPITCVSISSTGELGNGDSFSPTISANGRFVAFASQASNLVPGDTNGVDDVFVHDRLLGETRRISEGPSGEQANGVSRFPRVNFFGSNVTFDSLASNLVPDDTNGVRDIFRRAISINNTVRLNVGVLDEQANAQAFFPATAGDGSTVAYVSAATNLVAGIAAGNQIFARSQDDAFFTSTAERDDAGFESVPDVFLDVPVNAAGQHTVKRLLVPTPDLMGLTPWHAVLEPDLPWIEVHPRHGQAQPGDSELLTIRIDPRGLEPGPRTVQLRLLSDGANPRELTSIELAIRVQP